MPRPHRSVLCLHAAAILSPGGEKIKAYREMRRTRCSRAPILSCLSVYLSLRRPTTCSSVASHSASQYWLLSDSLRCAAPPPSLQSLSVGVVQDISGRKWEIHQSPDHHRPILELDARDEVIPKREGDRGRHWPSQFKRQCSLSLLPSSLDPVMPTEITPPACLQCLPSSLSLSCVRCECPFP